MIRILCDCVLARVMVLASVMVLAQVIVFAHVMVLAQVMVFAHVMVLARVMVLAVSCPLSARRSRRTKSRGPKGLQLEVEARRSPRLLVSYICITPPQYYILILESACPLLVGP